MRHLVGALLAAVMLLALAAGPASAGFKPYTLNIQPGQVSVRQAATFTATFAVPASASQQLGSADLTAPTGFSISNVSVPAPGTATWSGGTIQLRNLALQPGQSTSVSIDATAGCATGTLSWAIRAKQSNDFNGPPGNDLNLDTANSSITTTVTGGCATAVRFFTEPTSTGVDTVISGTPYTPGGPPVSVEVVDANNNRVTDQPVDITVALGPDSGSGPLSGTTTVTTVNGLAQFSDLKIGSAGSYSLSATSPGLTSDTSQPFQIDTTVVPCTEDLTCTGSISTPKTKLSITAFADPSNPDAGFLAASFNPGIALDCAGYTEISPDTAIVTVTSENRTKTLTMQIAKQLMNALPNNGASFLQFCFGSPAPFTTKSGATSVAQGTFDWDKNGTADPVYVGLLPDCSASAPPCVDSRNKTGTGDGVIAAKLPAGLVDPLGRT